jgi:hypothetical protein
MCFDINEYKARGWRVVILNLLRFEPLMFNLNINELGIKYIIYLVEHQKAIQGSQAPRLR